MPTQERAVSVRITPSLAVPPPGLRWREETLGLLTALVETTLSDLSDVSCHVATQPAPRFLDPERIDARLALTVDGGQDTFVLVASICMPKTPCRDIHVTGDRRDPFEPLARFIVQLAVLLERPVTREAIEEKMRASLSKNEYARLLTGRAAATLYGIMPPAPAASIGDKRKDPIARAVFLDPDQALAQWIIGRRDALMGRRESAISALDAAGSLQSKRTGFTNDLAQSLEGGDWPRAEGLYAQLARNAPNDRRFFVARANALIAMDRIDEAQQVLAGLPDRYAKVPDVLEMKVRIADARGSIEDGLLATWQESAPDRPEPVRRRIAQLVERGEFTRALTFTDELAKRGATEESVRLKMSLALAADDWETARASARTLGLAEVEARIGARARLKKGEDPIEVVADAKDRSGRLVRAELALREGRIVEALEDARALIRIAPHDSEALELRVRALRLAPHLGDLIEAQAVLYYADPQTAKRLQIARPAKKDLPQPAPHLTSPLEAPVIATSTPTFGSPTATTAAVN